MLVKWIGRIWPELLCEVIQYTKYTNRTKTISKKLRITAKSTEEYTEEKLIRYYKKCFKKPQLLKSKHAGFLTHPAERNFSITTIDLAYNAIGSEGAKTLAATIKF
ncbi:leucine-rich repeat domain-containing protein [Candidatus Cardinium hertigii]|uniref:Uncharacterized protein n=1 Tax=Candidatus Cardinium hertigii TaxID=247481 RepID=A0A2Z3LC08_9BACT|nr:leucine-rich repeat domain-containing protein [Candidatus Cardinium hertigii]AWN81712.1 hypothetical protein DK880_00384 [Candidatus Cardinium hertigii]